MSFQGSWIVKQSVGKKACLVGQALEINYFRGSNYLEVTSMHAICSNSQLYSFHFMIHYPEISIAGIFFFLHTYVFRKQSISYVFFEWVQSRSKDCFTLSILFIVYFF